MKKSILSLFVVLSTIFALNSCGGEKKIEQSPEMLEFVGMIKGQASDVVAALSKFGATDDIKTHDMSFYNLQEPKVTAKNGDCYTVEFKAGITVRIYEICWSNKKIAKITEKETK